MSLSGLFLISFLVIHCTVNALIFFNDGGETFTHAAHFMGTNPVIRTIEIGLVLGFLIHIFDGFYLWYQNRKARPQRYHYNKPSRNSSWYSRSMGILGSLLLIFLVIHTSAFWIPNRASQITTGEELNLYQMMINTFQHWWIVLIYLGGCFALFWHLLHGFKSAFQSLGLNHSRYNNAIKVTGTAFSVICPLIFALMPVSMYFGWIK